ncbi:WD40/YVTN/BNR-like repeat-containing protein [Pseudomonas sp. GCM10022188]|uniref:WD40/YVTN/BNR-like repeat-containing protein n=1 Tax=Pseudomonas TaxID=286 RepID=UPI001E2AAE82|nr:YCF48-related protein [Pseudomonas oryzagri]MCC6077462.1 YCF48-related protein [Pseudomonas oryzagri]
MGSFKKCALLALGIALGSSLQGIAQAGSYVDVLDLPAKPSALAVRSPLRDVAQAGQRLVAVGQRGHILYSDNGGKDWQQARVPVSADLNSVHFPTPQQGWAVGNDGVILHSSDAGASWNKQLDGRQIGERVLAHYQALAAAEPANETWAQYVAEGQRLVDEGADKPLLDVWFADARRGYAVGVFNLILHTEDGGQSWAPLQDRTDNPQSLHLNAISAVGEELYIAGEQGLLLKWDAAQQRFAALPTPYQGTWFGVVGKPGELLAYGLRGHVFRSGDGGQSWNQVETGLPVSITAGAVDARGDIWLFSLAGHALRGTGDGAGFAVVAQEALAPVAGVAQDGANQLVLVGERGVRTLALQ